MDAVGVAVVGSGNISEIYLSNLKRFPHLKLLGISDLDLSKAKTKADEHGISAFSVEEALSHPEVDIVLNLTVPLAHAEVTTRALTAGKHVYVEKPLGVTRAEGKAIMDLAAQKGLGVACAPDTFLGSSHQLCRNLIDEGAIGKPTSVMAFMSSNGPEGWHPNPEFYFEKGGGPMLDMGPYYLTALINLLGPITRVSGLTSRNKTERIVGSGDKKGKVFPVSIPTHVQGLLEFASGVTGLIVTSFDMTASHLPHIEIQGTEGALSVPDPNGFEGKVEVFKVGGAWEEVTSGFGYAENSRGLGLADLALAVREGREPRAGGNLAFHVLDVMQAIHEASLSGSAHDIVSHVDRPAALASGLSFGDIK